MQGLMEPTSVTIFAPTDEAFSKLSSGTVGGLLNNPPELTDLLTYHIIAEPITSDKIGEINSVKTIEGTSLNIVNIQGLHVNGVSISTADVEADNGIIHVIDEVLIPKSLEQFLTIYR